MECPTTCALLMLRASMTAIASSRAMSWLYFPPVVRNVGRRIAALAIGDAAVGAGEIPHLHLPRAVVACVFMYEDHRCAASGFFVVNPCSIWRCDVRHN